MNERLERSVILGIIMIASGILLFVLAAGASGCVSKRGPAACQPTHGAYGGTSGPGDGPSSCGERR